MKTLREELEQLCTTALGYGNWLELDISSPEIQKKINEIIEKYEPKVKPLRIVEDSPTNDYWDVYDGEDDVVLGITQMSENEFKLSFYNYHNGRFFQEDSFETFEKACEYVQEQWKQHILKYLE